MKKRIISAMLAFALLFGTLSGALPVLSFATEDVSLHEIGKSDVPLRLYYDEEASHGVAEGYDDVSESFGSDAGQLEKRVNDDWERWSIPLGNGYFGANVFGRTDTERIQLTEKTLANPYYVASGVSLGGLNNFSETYIDFGHTSTSSYSRELDLETAVSTVSYQYNGVTYTREYFTSYPDKAMIIKLDASAEGALDFVLRPTIPYEQTYMNTEGDGGGKTGTVTSSVTDGVGEITLSGTLEYFDIDLVGLYKVYTNGGTVSATTCTNADGDTDGTITVSGATGAYIVITMGTDYQLTSETFTASKDNKPTQTTTLDDAVAKVQGYMSSIDTVISGKSFDDAYTALKSRHLADYQELFGRVSLELNFDESDFELTTDVLLSNYKNGSGSTYLEALYFQYGRYLLIASSRSGALPANLQGAWNRYNKAPWSSGFWHNINVQMNYWPAFSTNIAETFEAYVEYNNAYMAKAESGASSKVNSYNPSVSGTDGGNGWSIDTGGYVSDINASTSIGNLGFTTQLFWEYYEYTQDDTLLREVVYPVLVGAARFITKMVKEDADGNYIAIYTDSPEQYVDGVWYYTDKGTAYAQSFAYQNNYNMLLAAKQLGIDFADTTHEDYAIIQTVMEQLDKYDPIRIGLSGQVKEFFEEENYGDLGEYTHRHISQLVGLYPANVINGTTPAWLDAADYVLTERGDEATGWGVAHRLTLWARAQNGERAHDLLNQLLSVNTATNLWDLHPPFQIDGNLGGTAGISEMLLQSHAGYIEPLAAIPASWASGSYTGLVARGNFEVSAAWAEGALTDLNIKSLAGGTASVKYSGIGSATVCDSSGNAVDYTVENGIISFDTEAGETYYIWNFTKEVKPEKVQGLTLESEFLSTSTLTWTASSDAVAYNVYVAKESEPTYTLLKTTKSTSYVYTPGELENLRLTFAVTAINSQGVESDRALVYRNPDDVSSPVESVSANVIDGELQVAIKSNDYAGTYKLYSKSNSSTIWTLVTESSYPIIIDPTYNSALQYAVSVVSLFGVESEITEITSFNASLDEVDYTATNIFAGNTIRPSEEGATYQHGSTDYGNYNKLTDGNFVYNQGRFSTKASAADVLEGTISLPTVFLLGELQLFDFNGSSSSALYAGSHLKVDVAVDGEWTTVAEYNSNEEILALRKSGTNGSYIGVPLPLVKAQQIRIRIDTPVYDTEQRSISLNEIQCTGIALNTGKVYTDNLLLGKEVVATAETETWTALDGGGASDVSGITDGTYKYSENSKWWRTWYGKENMTFDGTIDLGGECVLGELRLFYYAYWAAVGPNIQISVYNNDTWTVVHDLTITSSNLAAYKRSGTIDTTGTEEWLAFDMGGIKAEKIRIYLPPKSTSGENYGMYEVTLNGYYDNSFETVNKDNILLNKIPTATETNSTITVTSYGTYGFDKLTDGDMGIHTGRFAVNALSGNYATVTYDFGGKYDLGTLKIYDHVDGQTVPRSNETTIELLVDGEWVKYMDAQPLWTDAASTVVSGTARCVSFDVSVYTASHIRITFKNTQTDYTDGVTFYEIELSGTTKIDPNIESTSSSNVFAGNIFVPVTDNAWDTGTIKHSYDKLTDGVIGTDNRFVSAGTHMLDATLTFDCDYAELYTVTITYDSSLPKRCGSKVIIETYYNGEWTAHETVHTEAIASETINLGGVKAEKVRLYIPESFESGQPVSVFEITCSGNLCIDNTPEVEDTSSNILLGTTNDRLSLSGATIHSGTAVNNLENAFDGKLDTRYAVWDASPYSYTLEITLTAVYPLHTMTFYPFYNSGEASRSDDTMIEVYLDGVWVTAVDGFTIDASTSSSVSLGGIKGSKIRITFANTTWSASATIYEIRCTTGIVNAVDRSELLEAYKALDAVDTGDDAVLAEIKAQKLNAMEELLTNTTATQDDVTAAVTTVNTETAELALLDPEEFFTDSYGDFTSYNLLLSDEIGVNFYGEFADGIETTFPDAKVVITYADGSVETKLIADLTIDTSGRHVLSFTLPAAKMADIFKARVVFDGNNCGAAIETSIAKYANTIINDTSYETANPGITELVKSMLNYGAYAQLYFNYNVENLANAGVFEDGNNPVSTTDFSSVAGGNPVREGHASGVSPAGWTLALDSDVNIRFYFAVNNIHSYSFSVEKPDGETVELDALQYSQTVHRVDIPIEDASLIDNTYVLTITNVEDGSVMTVSFSAINYIGNVISGSVADASNELINVTKAMKLYSDAADAYVGQVD